MNVHSCAVLVGANVVAAVGGVGAPVGGAEVGDVGALVGHACNAALKSATVVQLEAWAAATRTASARTRQTKERIRGREVEVDC